MGKTATDKQPLGLSMMEKNKSVKERAQSYFESVKRNLHRDVIDKLVSKKEDIEDKLFELTNFTLDTNLNAGLQRMTKEDCEARFKSIIDLEYDLKLVELELKSKQESFKKYFES